MLRLIRFLFTGDSHVHKWTIIEERRVVGDGVFNSSNIQIGTKYISQCEHCGKLKMFKAY